MPYGVPTFTTRSGRLKRNQSESRFGNSLNAYTAFGGVPQAEDADGNKLDDGRFSWWI